jgi:hypothetical protein
MLGLNVDGRFIRDGWFLRRRRLSGRRRLAKKHGRAANECKHQAAHDLVSLLFRRRVKYAAAKANAIRPSREALEPS